MKQLKLERGKEELISTGGNYLCGHILQGLARKHLPEDFLFFDHRDWKSSFLSSLVLQSHERQRHHLESHLSRQQTAISHDDPVIAPAPQIE